MRRFIFIIVLFLAATALAAEAPAGLRADALNLLKALQATDTAAIFPEEFKSFTTTVEVAEELHERGKDAAADQLFSLAVLKGELLLKSKNEIPPPVVYLETRPPRPVFTPLQQFNPCSV